MNKTIKGILHMRYHPNRSRFFLKFFWGRGGGQLFIKGISYYPMMMVGIVPPLSDGVAEWGGHMSVVLKYSSFYFSSTQCFSCNN